MNMHNVLEKEQRALNDMIVYCKERISENGGKGNHYKKIVDNLEEAVKRIKVQK